MKPIKKSTKVLVKGDKSSKIFEVNPEAYKNVMHNEISKFCKKTPDNHINNINAEVRNLAVALKINDRVDKWMHTAY